MDVCVRLGWRPMWALAELCVNECVGGCVWRILLFCCWALSVLCAGTGKAGASAE